jgi:hypothetical protein
MLWAALSRARLTQISAASTKSRDFDKRRLLRTLLIGRSRPYSIVERISRAVERRGSRGGAATFAILRHAAECL